MGKYIIILFLALSGCTNLSNLQKPAQALEFKIENDIVVFYDAGMFDDIRHCRGLLKGTYEAIAEDEDGYYFSAVSGKVVQLIGPPAEEFERTKVYPDFKDLRSLGIWIPKPGNKKPADIFQVTGVVDISEHYRPGGGGAITYGMSHLLNGTVVFWHEQNFPDISNISSLINPQ
ncbi:hypothetical protein LRS11_16190 [Pseudomonas sp. J452]|uniref:hypothetical protein n=1 Tax=Pseudomonas sp. J452 TaxID=2898441 RepID=UPI0021AE0618|nr:hypothetical protein [Pseudomonas sp. J452]UUY07353.1 hypothetical protein LRS11_16190 [Pseudomonas sp. J452]